MTDASVTLWGTPVGAASWLESSQSAAFQYHPDFLASRIELAPSQMPLAAPAYQFPELGGTVFNGLPGLLADVLPDRFTRLVFGIWQDMMPVSQRSLGLEPGCQRITNPLQMLSVASALLPGAIGVQADADDLPALMPAANGSDPLTIDTLVGVARRICDGQPCTRQHVQALLSTCWPARGRLNEAELMPKGYLQANMLMSWDPLTDQLFTDGDAATGAEWVVTVPLRESAGVLNHRRYGTRQRRGDAPHKSMTDFLDGSGGGADRGTGQGWRADAAGDDVDNDRELFNTTARIAHASNMLAHACGLEVPESRLHRLQTGEVLFMHRRVDATVDTTAATTTILPLHRQSWAALSHLDVVRFPHAFEDQVLQMRCLGLGVPEFEQLFRRVVFSQLVGDSYDGVERTLFCMDRGGHWQLMPAQLQFCGVPGYGRDPDQGRVSVNAKTRGAEFEDLLVFASSADVKPVRARDIIHQQQQRIRLWPEFAAAAGLSEALCNGILPAVPLASGIAREGGQPA